MAAASSSSLPAWLRRCVEMQPDLDLDGEEEMRRKKKKQVVEVEMDQFGRLPDEVVLIIVNKLFDPKTLLRFSLAAKRYSSLASQTHSLILDFSLASCPDADVAAAATGFMGGFLTSSAKQKVSAITHRFQQIERLHLYLPTPNPPLGIGRGSGNGDGVFSRWVAVFGSNFEQFLFISAASVNPPVPGLDIVAVAEPWHNLFQMVVRTAMEKHKIAKSLLVSNCKMIETAILFDSSRGGAVLMGKRQIAKLRANHQIAKLRANHQIAKRRANRQLDHPPPPAPLLSADVLQQRRLALPKLHMVGYRLRTLDLPKTGYALNGVTVVSAIFGDQNQQPIVELMGGCEEMVDGGFKWDVFTEAAALVSSNDLKNKEKMYDFVLPS